MRALLFLALPLAGLFAVDPVSFDYHAVKSTVLMAGAFGLLLYAALSGQSRRTAISLPLLVFLAVRGSMLIGHPWSGRAWRSWSLLLALTLCAHVAPSRAQLRRLVPGLLGTTGVLLSLFALTQWGLGERQAHATMANRNFLAIALAMLVPFVLSCDRRRGLRWVLLAALVAGLLATKSRGGALAATAAFALWALWRRRFWMAPVLVLAPVVVLAAVLAFGRGAVKDRLYWYEAAWDMGTSHTLRGVGADGFRREYPPVRTLDEHAISGGRVVHAVHNDYLESFAEGGVPGLLAHLLLLAGVGWAVRRDRRAGPALLAFAVGSLIGLPLHDPALLALAFVCAALGARRCAPLPLRRAAPVLGNIAVLGFLLLHGIHWLGDREFGRYLKTQDAQHLDRALGLDRRHAEALLSRATGRDLELLVSMEPHHGNALYLQARKRPDGEDKEHAFREILLRHDPHHVPSRIALARLVKGDDPAQAASLLEGAIAADPRRWASYAAMAEVQREQGNLAQAGGYLRKAEQRTRAAPVAHERLELSLATLRAHGETHSDALHAAVAALPAVLTRRRIETALAAAEKRAQTFDESRPALTRGADEGDLEFIRRKRTAEAPWLRRRQDAVHGFYVEAQLLAGALTHSQPSAAHYRLWSRTQHGLRHFEIARQLEALALFLEALNGLAGGNEDGARRKLARAMRAHPDLGTEKNIRKVLAAWLQAHADRRAAAKRLLHRYPDFRDSLK